MSNDFADLKGVRVMAVDSDPDSLYLLKVIFEQCGCTDVTTATTAQEALHLLKKSQPHILISELRLADANGYSLVRQIKQQKSIPAIALTASVWQRDRDRAIAAGFCQHLPKPFDYDELISIVVALVGKTA
ncbi:response regulator [Almyronema epifaneia]|uniref:Response regulator n=1 Tax=Almyronema epifaneia S1 TaxID=2991925 RepID=A0ABW6IIM7_9CYAN